MSPPLKLNPAPPGPPLRSRRRAASSGPGAGARPRRHVWVDVLGNLTEVAPEGVVTAPRLRIGQDVVGLRDVLEPVLGPRVVVDVRMVGAGQLAVGALDLVLAGVPRHAQDLVEVLVRPSARPGHHHLRGPQLVVSFAVGRPDDLGHHVGLGPGSGRVATASCRAGSNLAPRSSRRGKPRRASTSRACARTARTPSMMVAGSAVACASARSRLSITGSHCLATAALASASARLTCAAHLLRTLSRSARARRRRSSSSAIRAAWSAIVAATPAPRPRGPARRHPVDGGRGGGAGQPRAAVSRRAAPGVWFTGLLTRSA